MAVDAAEDHWKADLEWWYALSPEERTELNNDAPRQDSYWAACPNCQSDIR